MRPPPSRRGRQAGASRAHGDLYGASDRVTLAGAGVGSAAVLGKVRVMDGLRALAALGVAGCVAVAGCSDDGDGDGGGFPPERRSYAEQYAAREAIFQDALDADGNLLPYADPAALPQSGSATYTGGMGLFPVSDDEGPVDTVAEDGALIGEDGLQGDFQLVVGFRDERVAGLATNFVTAEEREIGGAITFEGDLDRLADVETEYTFLGNDVEGTLTAPDGATWEVQEGFWGGDFIGEGRGIAIGDMYVDFENRATDEVLSTGGGFSVRRDP